MEDHQKKNVSSCSVAASASLQTQPIPPKFQKSTHVGSSTPVNVIPYVVPYKSKPSKPKPGVPQSFMERKSSWERKALKLNCSVPPKSLRLLRERLHKYRLVPSASLTLQMPAASSTVSAHTTSTTPSSSVCSSGATTSSSTSTVSVGRDKSCYGATANEGAVAKSKAKFHPIPNYPTSVYPNSQHDLHTDGSSTETNFPKYSRSQSQKEVEKYTQHISGAKRKLESTHGHADSSCSPIAGGLRKEQLTSDASQKDITMVETSAASSGGNFTDRNIRERRVSGSVDSSSSKLNRNHDSSSSIQGSVNYNLESNLIPRTESLNFTVFAKRRIRNAGTDAEQTGLGLQRGVGISENVGWFRSSYPGVPSNPNRVSADISRTEQKPGSCVGSLSSPVYPAQGSAPGTTGISEMNERPRETNQYCEPSIGSGSNITNSIPGFETVVFSDSDAVETNRMRPNVTHLSDLTDTEVVTAANAIHGSPSTTLDLGRTLYSKDKVKGEPSEFKDSNEGCWIDGESLNYDYVPPPMSLDGGNIRKLVPSPAPLKSASPSNVSVDEISSSTSPKRTPPSAKDMTALSALWEVCQEEEKLKRNMEGTEEDIRILRSKIDLLNDEKSQVKQTLEDVRKRKRTLLGLKSTPPNTSIFGRLSSREETGKSPEKSMDSSISTAQQPSLKQPEPLSSLKQSNGIDNKCSVTGSMFSVTHQRQRSTSTSLPNNDCQSAPVQMTYLGVVPTDPALTRKLRELVQHQLQANSDNAKFH